MKELIQHCDYVKFEGKSKTKVAEEDVPTKGEVKNVLFVRIAIEKQDEGNVSEVVEKSVSDLIDISKKVSTRNVLLYPYVHLLTGSEPGDLKTARNVMDGLYSALKKKKFSVTKAPFGWYKEFEMKCKGHPLAELSRVIRAGEGELSQALAKEKKLKSSWYILVPSGKVSQIKMEKGQVKGFDFSKYPNLEKFARYELAKSREVTKEPPHVELMQRLQIADYEPGSDPGNLRFYPKGKLIKSLIEDWVTRKTVEYGAMEIESPIMYDFEHPSLKSYLNRFPARQYAVHSLNRRHFLRFSACFGQFLMAHDATLSYKNLPIKIYELAKSFRVEKRGELTGLRRLRAFTMPDCHAICSDLDSCKKEMKERIKLSKTIQDGVGLEKKDFEFAVRMVGDFWKKNRKFIVELVKGWGRPSLVEVWDKKFFYFVMKHEWNFVDNLGKASTLTTDQIDIENAERYGIEYVDKGGKKRTPLILHLSPSGAIERVIYALLEKAYMQEKEKKHPVFPLWLAPVQVRLCPVSDGFLPYTKKVAEELQKQNIRVDIDDNTETISKKIRNAEREWINYIVVIGDKEKKSKKLAVRDRKTAKVAPMSSDALVKMIRKETDGKPFKPLPLPMLLTKRPSFR